MKSSKLILASIFIAYALPLLSQQKEQKKQELLKKTTKIKTPLEIQGSYIKTKENKTKELNGKKNY